MTVADYVAEMLGNDLVSGAHSFAQSMISAVPDPLTDEQVIACWEALDPESRFAMRSVVTSVTRQITRLRDVCNTIIEDLESRIALCDAYDTAQRNMELGGAKDE